MTVEDPSNEGVQVALVHELARLSLGKDRYFVNFIAECDATPGEKLVALLQAASASTSPVGRFIRSIKDLMLNMVDLTLISSYLEQTIKNGSRNDIILQVATGLLLQQKTGQREWISYVIQRLDKFPGTYHDLLVLRPIGLKVKELATLPFSVGLGLLIGIFQVKEQAFIEPSAKWLGDNVPSRTLLCALDHYYASFEMLDPLIAVLNRLLLRSPTSALEIIHGLPNSINFNRLLGSLSDPFWSQICSENDDNRQRAERVLLNASCLDPNLLGEKIGKSFVGKGTKAKKTMLSLLYRLGGSPLANDTIKSFLAKETNEDIVYYLASCLVAAGVKGLDSEALKQTKASFRSAYLAAIVGSEISQREPMMDILSKKETLSIDSLLITLSFARSDKIPATVLKLALVPNGFLSERNVALAAEKYPLLPWGNMVHLFSLANDMELWKSLIHLYITYPFQQRQIVKALQKLGPDTEKLALVAAQKAKCSVEELSNHRFNVLCQFIKVCVNNRRDLANFVIVANSHRFSQVGLWAHLVAKVKIDDSSEHKVYQKLIVESFPREVIAAALAIFPKEICSDLAEDLGVLIKLILEINSNEENLRIFAAPDEQLPITDVIAGSKRSGESMAVKKDSFSKKSPTFSTASSATNMSKSEKAAFEAELARERQIKGELQAIRDRLVRLSHILLLISKTCPLTFEPFLVRFHSLLNLTSVPWTCLPLSKIVYSLTACCVHPPGRHGPLLASAWYTLVNPSLIDIDWHFANSKDLVEAVCRYLKHEPSSQSTFSLVIPFIAKIFANATFFDLEDIQAQDMLSYTRENLCFSMGSEANHLILDSFPALLQTIPGISMNLVQCLDGLLRHISKPEIEYCSGLLRDSNELIRRLGLQCLEVIKGRVDEETVFKQFNLWLLVISNEPSPANRLLAGKLLSHPSAVDLQGLIGVALNQDLDSCLNFGARRALLSMIEELNIVEMLSSLEVIYQDLWKGRLPELVNVRSIKLDLTLRSRELWSLLLRDLASFGPHRDISFIPSLIGFLLKTVFFDTSETVHGEALNAAGSFVTLALKETEIVDQLANLLDAFLASTGRSDDEYDRVRVYAVILLAKVADKFPQEDPRRHRLLSLLFATLNTPSESVQNATADAMVNLFLAVEESLVSDYLDKLLNNMIHGKSMAVRRGAAYGLGALIKGRSTRILKSKNILDKLTSVIHDKNSAAEAKQGALFGLEMIARYLGRCFEPYIVKLIDVLMASFSDGRTEIREASLETAQAMMATVSSLGARLLLHLLLNQMGSSSWRSKVGAIEWLGAMTSLAPRILAKQLPLILPRLVESLTDSHHNVQRASREALTRYGSVVRNPEIKALSSVILEALANPPQFTEKCLNALLHTAFSHVIDGPSLAILEPILERALRDRATGGTEVKKKAAQILGNLATNLVDARDLVQVLSSLVPALLGCLSDPVPEVRSHCGKVLGVLVRTVGEKHPTMAALAPRLLSIISGPEATSVDRAGAAQAFAEILAARGPEKIQREVIEGIILENLCSSRAVVREGFVMLVGFMPLAFDAHGTLSDLYDNGLKLLVGPSLGLLADENEAVREAASISCHNIIALCARIDHVAIFDMLVETMSDSRWRCRLGCLKLFQEFLSKFATNSESDVDMGIFAMPSVDDLIQGGIDMDRLYGLMSRAFLYRFDPNSSAIRHNALTIWKGLASHPLRALINILPVLIDDLCILITQLNSVLEAREIVEKALEDVLGKLGDRLLGKLLSRCLELIEEEDEVEFGGIFIATIAAKLLGSGSFPGVNTLLLDECIPKFIKILLAGLASPREASQDQAGLLFNALITSCDRLAVPGTVERIVEPMLEELTSNSVYDPVALSGLVKLLESDSSDQTQTLAMQHLLTFWKNPLDDQDAVELAETVLQVIKIVFQTLGAEAAPHTIPMLRIMFKSPLYPRLALTLTDDTIRTILSSLEADEDSPYQVSLSQLLEGLYGDGHRDMSYRVVRVYCSVPDADLQRFYDIWPRRLLADFSAIDEARLAFEAMIKAINDTTLGVLYHLSESVDEALGREKVKLEFKDTVAVVVTKLIIPLLTQTSYLAAENEDRRRMACRLAGRLASSVPSLAWGPALISLVGALIRTASDRNTTASFVFDALTACVVSQTALVRPFHPQLQRIFSNALAIESTREQAVLALSALLPLLSRPEPLITELFSIILSEQHDLDTRLAVLQVLYSTSCSGTDTTKVTEVAEAVMSNSEAQIRDLGALWIKSIKDKSDLEGISSKLESLLLIN